MLYLPPNSIEKWGVASFIELDDFVEMCENCLESGAGDIDADGDIDFYDFAEFGLAWKVF